MAESLDTDKVRTREIDALAKAMNELKVSSGLILTYDHEEKVQVDGKNVMVKPIYKWLLEEAIP